MTELEQLTALCARLGASPTQAATMAAQLQKRAAQLAIERGTTAEGELQRLLELMISGRAGNVPKDFQAPPPRPAGE